MRTLRIRPDGRGAPRLEALELPFLCPGPSATAENHDRAPAPEMAAEVGAVRSRRLGAGTAEPEPAGGRRLTVVVAGSVVVTVPDMQAVLEPGDVLFADDPGDGVQRSYP